VLRPILQRMSNMAFRFTQRYHPNLPPEFVLPCWRKTIALEEFPYIVARRENPDWSETALRVKIATLGTWEYYFAFSHGLSTNCMVPSMKAQ
jgi:hypothetical protein